MKHWLYSSITHNSFQHYSKCPFWGTSKFPSTSSLSSDLQSRFSQQKYLRIKFHHNVPASSVDPCSPGGFHSSSSRRKTHTTIAKVFQNWPNQSYLTLWRVTNRKYRVWNNKSDILWLSLVDLQVVQVEKRNPEVKGKHLTDLICKKEVLYHSLLLRLFSSTE